MAIRVLVADDQALLRSGFRMLIGAQEDMEPVGEAEDGAQAVELARRRRPDVVLMDVRMPRLDGIAATERIVAAPECAGTRVLVLTTFDLDRYVYGALRAGASGFLLKDAPAEEVLVGIRTVAAGASLLAPAVTARLVERFVTGPPPEPDPEGPLAELTPREREVLTLVARGRSNGEIAAELVVAETTVKSHIGAVFDKLGVRDRAQAIVWAYEHGLVWPGPAAG